MPSGRPRDFRRPQGFSRTDGSDRLPHGAARRARSLPAAQAAGPAATARALDREMQRAGAASGAYVVDLDTGQELYSRSADVARIPASVNKLYTTAAALRAYGRLGQLTTEVLGDAAPDEKGVVAGNLYLRGNGDPSFGPAQAAGLARVLVGSGLTRVTGTVIGDESRFDAPPRRPVVRLPHRLLGRPAQRPLLQPRRDRRPLPPLPDRSRPLRGREVPARAAPPRRARAEGRPGRRDARRAPRRSASGPRRAWRGSRARPTARRTTTTPRRC